MLHASYAIPLRRVTVMLLGIAAMHSLRGEPATFEAKLVADATVRSSELEQARDHTKNLSIARLTDHADQTFLRFDASSFPSAVKITRATLIIRSRNDFPASEPVEVRVVKDDSWDEEKLVYKNAPKAVGLLGTFTSDAMTPGTSQIDEIDVTEYVTASLKASDDLISFQLSAPQVGTAVFIRAKEHPDQSEHPWARLEIEFETSAQESKP